MSEKIIINTELLSGNTNVICDNSTESNNTLYTFCDLFNSKDPSSNSNNDLDPHTTYPSSLSTIKMKRFIKAMPFAQMFTSSDYSTMKGTPVYIGVNNDGTTNFLSTRHYLSWDANTDIKTKQLWTSYRDKVNATVFIKVHSQNSRLLDTIIIHIPITKLASSLESENIPLQGFYSYSSGNVSEYLKPSMIKIEDIGLTSLDSTISTSTMAQLLADLKTSDIKIRLKALWYSLNSTSNADTTIDGTHTIPANDFSNSKINLKLHYFAIELPQQFSTSPVFQHSNIMPVTNVVDLSKIFSVTTPIKFEMGILDNQNVKLENAHNLVGEENYIFHETSNGETLGYKYGYAHMVDEPTYEPSYYCYKTSNNTKYLYADFISHCLANSRLKIYGTKNSTKTLLANASAYSLFKVGVTISDINQYSSLSVECYLPDLMWLRHYIDSESSILNKAGSNINSFHLYNIKYSFGAQEDNEHSSAVPSMSEGIYIGTKRVARMFIGTQEVASFIADKETKVTKTITGTTNSTIISTVPNVGNMYQTTGSFTVAEGTPTIESIKLVSPAKLDSTIVASNPLYTMFLPTATVSGKTINWTLKYWSPNTELKAEITYTL